VEQAFQAWSVRQNRICNPLSLNTEEFGQSLNGDDIAVNERIVFGQLGLALFGSPEHSEPFQRDTCV
jgi:hypothetical protein